MQSPKVRPTDRFGRIDGFLVLLSNKLHRAATTSAAATAKKRTRFATPFAINHTSFSVNHNRMQNIQHFGCMFCQRTSNIPNGVQFGFKSIHHRRRLENIVDVGGACARSCPIALRLPSLLENAKRPFKPALNCKSNFVIYVISKFALCQRRPVCGAVPAHRHRCNARSHTYAHTLLQRIN